MPLLIQNYVSRHPNIKIKQYQAISERATHLILNNEVDFAISSSKIEHRDISWEPIIQDDIYLTVSKEHPLSQCTSLELTQIKDERLIGQIEG